MTETKKNITDTTVFSPECRERFLPTETRWSSHLDERGITLAGLSWIYGGSTLARRDKAYHSILCCIDGECEFHLEGSSAVLKPGDLWFVPAHIPFCYQVDRYLEIAWFHILKKDPKHYGFGADVRLYHDVDFDDLQFVMDRYSLESSSKSAASESIAYALGLLVGMYLDRMVFSCHERNLEDDRTRQFHSLWLEVKKNPAFGWTTENLAKKIGLSPGHFRTLVKEIEQDTAMNIVTQLRMNQAKILLPKSDYKLSTVAYLVGYNSPFSFSRAFKRVVGVSPQEYRDQVRRND